MADFGFVVAQAPSGWRVYLPHQCNTWDIAGEYRDGDDYEVALARMEKFIEQATVARDALKQRRATGPDYD